MQGNEFQKPVIQGRREGGHGEFLGIQVDVKEFYRTPRGDQGVVLVKIEDCQVPFLLFKHRISHDVPEVTLNHIEDLDKTVTVEIVFPLFEGGEVLYRQAILLQTLLYPGDVRFFKEG